MARKAAGRAARNPPREGTRRSTRHQPNAVLEPMRDDIDRVTRRPGRGGRGGGQHGGRQRGSSRPTGSTEAHGDANGLERAGNVTNNQGSAPQDSNTTISGRQQTPSGQPATSADQPAPPLQSATSANPPDASGPPVQAAGSTTGAASGPTESPKSTRGGKKRAASADTASPESPKKAKTNSRDKIGTQSRDERPGPVERESCTNLEQSIARWREEANDDNEAFDNPVTEGSNLEEVDVFRALAAMTEAITANGTHCFSLVDPSSLQHPHPYQTIARVGERMLIPYARGGHISLFVFRNASDPNATNGRALYRAMHFDSARRVGHRGERFQENFNIVRDMVLRSRWISHDDSPVPEPGIIYLCGPVTVVAPQSANWTCGLHTIFNGWAHALRLNLSPHIERYDDFIRQGMEIVRLAVRGHMNSQTIWEFFDCFRFIQPGQAVEPSRAFDQTHAFRTATELNSEVARVRLEEDLAPLIRREAPGTVGLNGLDDALVLLEEIGMDLDIVTMTADQVLQRIVQHQDFIRRTTGDSGAKSSGAGISPTTAAAQPAEEEGGMEQQQALLGSAQARTSASQADQTSTSRNERPTSSGQTDSGQTSEGVQSDDNETRKLQEEYEHPNAPSTAGPTTAPATNLDGSRGTAHRHAGRIGSESERPLSRASLTPPRAEPPGSLLRSSPGSSRTLSGQEAPAGTRLAHNLLSYYPNLPELDNEEHVRQRYEEQLGPFNTPPDGNATTKAQAPQHSPPVGSGPAARLPTTIENLLNSIPANLIPLVSDDDNGSQQTQRGRTSGQQDHTPEQRSRDFSVPRGDGASTQQTQHEQSSDDSPAALQNILRRVEGSNSGAQGTGSDRQDAPAETPQAREQRRSGSGQAEESDVHTPGGDADGDGGEGGDDDDSLFGGMDYDSM